MARQSGPLKYKGTLGDIRHFKIKGLQGHFAGLVGGPTGEQVKTAPEFERTRENMNEFGGCAAAGKSIRVGLAQLMKQMSDPQLTGRLTAIMKKINLEDLTEATLTVPAFNPVNFVNAPAGATHFRLISAISVISDFEFNSTSGIYEPIDPSLNEVSNVAYSNYIDLGAPVALPTTITSTLPGSPVLTADVSVLNCIGIEFYQQVGVNYYLFNSGNALKVQDIF